MSVDPFQDLETPWVTSTPQSRLQPRQVRTVNGAVEGTETLPLVPPPPPVVDPPAASVASTPTSTLTDEEKKQLASLRELKTTGIVLTENLQTLYNELDRKEKAMVQTTISHSQLNKLSKLRTQSATLSKKIAELDVQWGSFMRTIMNRVREHGQQYQTCRADLLASLTTKQEELQELKLTITKASENLTLQTDVPNVANSPVDVLKAMEELKKFQEFPRNKPISLLDDDHEEDLEDMEVEEDEEEEELVAEPPMEPEPVEIETTKLSPHTQYRVSPSPGRGVATTHLKPKKNRAKTAAAVAAS